MKAFKMPSLGADMEEGTLVEWLKSPGENIARGDIVAVVETVKGAIEIECFDEGVLIEPLIEVGTTVTVGEVLAYLDGPAEENEEKAGIVEISVAPGEVAKPPAVTSAPLPDAPRSRASPAARKRARELGVDINQIAPGGGQVIGLAEVEAAATATRSASPSEMLPRRGLDFDAMRQAIGRAMARSKREIPHYYVSSSLDVTLFYQWMAAGNAERSVADRILYAAPLIKAVAIALKQVPTLNGTYEGQEHRPNPSVHIGVAIAIRGGGLIAPAIHDADQLGVDETMTQLRDLVARVRSGRIRGSEMSDPTVTISILGDDTADSLQPVIYPPQVAIIGCGAIRDRPWAVDGAIAVRKVMNVTVAADHRVSDGRAAARFLKRLDAILQEPASL